MAATRMKCSHGGTDELFIYISESLYLNTMYAELKSFSIESHEIKNKQNAIPNLCDSVPLFFNVYKLQEHIKLACHANSCLFLSIREFPWFSNFLKDRN